MHEGKIFKGRFLLLLFIAILLAYDPWASCCRAEESKGQSQIDRTIVELQPSRQASSIKIEDAQGEEGLATLTNLNPSINVWYFLQLKWRKGATIEAYHLENANPKTQTILLENEHPYGLIIDDGKDRHRCDLSAIKFHDLLKKARTSGAPYTPLCGGKMYLRNPAKGHRTRIEIVADFLRDKVPGGEKIVVFVRDTFFKGLHREESKGLKESESMERQLPRNAENGPEPALLDPKQVNRAVQPTHLGIEIKESDAHGMIPGTWYDVKDNPGILVSLMEPKVIMPEILRSYRKVVSDLDRAEAGALVYLVAFDLDQFDLKFTLGTEHPRLNWSDHMLDKMRDKSLPGPDGIDSIAPLVSTGLINPMDAGRTIASFTGGFKRTHGAFRYGDLASKNRGSHYGFIENGVIFSKLQPGLSTIYTLHEGWTDLKTWTEEDNQLLPGIKYARQNGVSLIEDLDPVAQMSVPGPFVSRWGEGNWSGSADRKLRTLRAGIALQEIMGKRFLIYAVFTSATPSAMARVFQAYQCRYAMLLDMNALEHTYLAIYKRQESKLYVQHLIQGMSEVDRSVKEQYIPRFLGYPDNRDFFYLVRKEKQ